MTTISAQLVKELREKTGVGMMHCKNALVSTSGNFEEAVKMLREKGLVTASKKSTREAREGRIITLIDNVGKKGVILEINCETDFVAQNSDFIAFGNKLANTILNDDIKDLESLIVDGKSLKDFTSELVLKLGENISVKKFDLITTDGKLFKYTHSNGKVGVLINFSDSIDDVIGKDIAMHTTAMAPLYVSSDQVPAQEIEKEKEILKSQVINEGKPEQIADKIVQGRLNKFFKEQCLLEQAFVKEQKKAVKEVLPSGVTIKSFVRYSI